MLVDLFRTKLFDRKTVIKWLTHRLDREIDIMLAADKHLPVNGNHS